MRLFAKYRPILWTVYLRPEQGAVRSVARRLTNWEAARKVEELQASGAKAWMEPA